MTGYSGRFLLIAVPFLAIYGLVSIFNPEATWRFDHLFLFWAYRSNPEPSNAALIVRRIWGAVCVLLAIAAAVLLIHYGVSCAFHELLLQQCSQ